MEVHSQPCSIGLFSLETENSEPQISSSELGDLINANFALKYLYRDKQNFANKRLCILQSCTVFFFHWDKWLRNFVVYLYRYLNAKSAFISTPLSHLWRNSVRQIPNFPLEHVVMDFSSSFSSQFSLMFFPINWSAGELWNFPLAIIIARTLFFLA